MNHIFKGLMGILMFVAITFSFVGCGGGDTSNTPLKVASRYTTHQSENVSEGLPPYTSFKDGDTYFYMFHLGYVSDVPMQSDFTYFKYSGNNYSHSFTTTSTTTTHVETSCAYTSSKTSTWDEKFEVSDSIKVGGSIKKIINIENTIKFGYSKTSGGASTQSWTDTYTTATTFSENHSKTVDFNFNETMRHGYYRFILLGTVEVYAVIVFDSVEETYYLDTITAVSGYGYGLDYSTSSKFDDNTFTEFDFDPNIVYTLEIPTQSVEDWQETEGSGTVWPDELKTAWVTVRNAEIKVTDFGRFSQPYDLVMFEDVFGVDLDEMKTAGYKYIDFKLSMTVYEKDDGYQDIFLFNKLGNTNSDLVDSLQFEHGKGKKDTTSWVHGEKELFFDNISIDEFVDCFVLRYGASGKNEDTWYNSGVQVRLIFKK